MTLVKPLDIAPARLIDIFTDTSGAPAMLRARAPAIASALDGRNTAPVTFDIDSIRKDLRTMLAEGHALGAELPVTERALTCFDSAAKDGLGADDGSALPAYWSRRSS